MLNKKSLGFVVLVFVVLVGTAASDGADERAISSPAISLPAEEQVRATEVAAAAVALPSLQRWYATAEGHVGDIYISEGYQVIFCSSMISGPNYITINNDGPMALCVWIDPGSFKPEENNISESFIIKPGQSSSVVAMSLLLVKEEYPSARPTRGDYVLSWCCPDDYISPV